MLIKPEQPSHWYKSDGTPAYGSTLREARRDGLYPSVTSISQVIQKPAIEAWKQNLLMETMYESVIDSDWWCAYNPEHVKKTIICEWKENMSAAAELGTKVHDAIEGMTVDDDSWVGTDMEPYCLAVRDWMEKNIINNHIPEACFAHPLGFGGRVDLYGEWGKRQRPFVLDYKTQGKPGDKMVFYPDMAIQLAANAAGVGSLDGDLISVLLSTVEPGELRYKCWGDDPKRNNEYWLARFINRCRVWADEKNYWPVPLEELR